MPYDDNLYKIHKPLIGVDIGFNSIKIVQLSKGDVPSLLAYNILPTPPRVIASVNEQDKQRVIAAIRDSLAKARPRKIKTNLAISGLPESKVFTKILQMPNLTPEEMIEAVPHEANRQIPLAIEQTYLDWQPLNLNTDRTQEILVVVAPKNLVDLYLQMFTAVGLNLIALETKPIAAVRALIRPQEPEASLIVDIGAEATGIIVYDLNTIKFTYTIPHGANAFTKTIAYAMKISEQEAEKLKRQTGFKKDSKKGNEILESIKPAMQDIIDEIGNAKKYYENRSKPPRKIQKIKLTGGGAYTPGIVEYISQSVNLKTELGNPLINVAEHSLGDFPRNEVLRFTTAFGLALRENY